MRSGARARGRASGVACAAWMFALVCAALPVCAEPTEEPEAAGRLAPFSVTGTVTAVDRPAERLVLAADGARRVFRLTPETIVLQGERRVHDEQLEPGYLVRVYPRIGDDPRTAGLVEILLIAPDVMPPETR